MKTNHICLPFYGKNKSGSWVCIYAKMIRKTRSLFFLEKKTQRIRALPCETKTKFNKLVNLNESGFAYFYSHFTNTNTFAFFLFTPIILCLCVCVRACVLILLLIYFCRHNNIISHRYRYSHTYLGLLSPLFVIAVLIYMCVL